MSCSKALAALAVTLAAGCAVPRYAQFEPLRADAPSRRVERPAFSILVPSSFSSVVERDDGTLIARETPPANGENRVYRLVDVRTAPGVDGDEAAALQSVGLAALRSLRAKDDFVESEHGSATIAGRAAFFVQGACSAGAADLRFDVLDFFVPGSPKSLVVQCAIPEGQLAASRAGFVAIANSLQTHLAPPGAAAGELRWFDDDRVGLRLRPEWQRQADDEGALAVFVHSACGARCDLVTKATDAPVDLDRVAQNWVGEKIADWPCLTVLSMQRARRGDRDVLRVRAAYRDGGETVVVDDTYAVTQDRLDRLLFRVPLFDYHAERAAIDGAAASLRWKSSR